MNFLKGFFAGSAVAAVSVLLVMAFVDDGGVPLFRQLIDPVFALLILVGIVILVGMLFGCIFVLAMWVCRDCDDAGGDYGERDSIDDSAGDNGKR